MEWFVGGEVVIEFFESGEETIECGVPRQGSGVMPRLLAHGEGECPVKEVAQMCQDLRRCACLVADVEAVEMFRSAAKSFAAAIRDSGNAVAEKLARRIRC